MTKKQQDKIEKFKKFTRWMCEDLERSMFCARANFLVAMGLFNYIEILGTFMIGYFQKDNAGCIKKDKKGKKIKTSSTDRFNKFFSYLGNNYENLVKKYNVYDELRCGLTHEYLPKNKSFCIYGSDRYLTEQEMDNLKNNDDNSKVDCGVIYLAKSNKWQIFNPKLFIDFKRGIDKLIKAIGSNRDRTLLKNFFEAAAQINLENFG